MSQTTINKMSSATCEDILLTFLSDAGENWEEAFIFGDPNVDMNINDYLLPSKSFAETVEASTATSFESKSTSLEEEVFFNDLGVLDWDLDLSAGEVKSQLSFLPNCFANAHSFSAVSTTSDSEQEDMDFAFAKDEFFVEIDEPKKKRKSSYVCKKNKKLKIPAIEKVKRIVNLLKEMQRRNQAEVKALPSPPFVEASTASIAYTFLSHILGSKSVTVPDLVKVTTPTVTLSFPALSSLHEQVQQESAKKNLTAFIKPNTHMAFPIIHNGVGQVASAARGFQSTMADLLSYSILSNINFTVEIPSHTTMVTPGNDQLTAPFTWRTDGMIRMGFQGEMNFNGLLRCTISKYGFISSASITYDGAKIVRCAEELLKACPPSPIPISMAPIT